VIGFPGFADGNPSEKKWFWCFVQLMLLFSL